MSDELVEKIARLLATELGHDRVDDLARSVLSCIEESGMVVVPREPTEAMTHAGWTHLYEDDTPEDIWASMVAVVSPANPSPSSASA
jgi:hypothetical protein